MDFLEQYLDRANEIIGDRTKEQKVDEFILALLYLVTHERQEGLGARAWKGFGWAQ